MKKDSQNKREEEPSKSWDGTRRDFIKKPLALAAGSIVMPSWLGSLMADAKDNKHGDDLTIAPRYYPLNHFRPEINLTGKLAVITGASRGNGRAIGEALTALGVDVIGTSRGSGQRSESSGLSAVDFGHYRSGLGLRFCCSAPGPSIIPAARPS
jgi:hypothetical protein